jgi:hypothetical protein
LTAYLNRTISASGVPIVSVPSASGFWIRPDDGPLLWVQLVIGLGQRPTTFRTGQVVDLSGTVRPLAVLPTELGLSGSDARQLASSGLYIEAPEVAVIVHTG